MKRNISAIRDGIQSLGSHNYSGKKTFGQRNQTQPKPLNENKCAREA